MMHLASLAVVGLLLVNYSVSTSVEKLHANPTELTDLEEQETQVIQLIFTNCTDTKSLKNVSITAGEGAERKLIFPEVVNNIPCQFLVNGSLTKPVELKVTGKVVSYVTLILRDTETGDLLLEYPMGVIRKPNQVKDKVFLYGLIVMVVFNTTCFGISLNLEKVKKYFRKPIAPGIGVFCQFLLMPMIAFALTQLIDRHPSQKLGVFTAGVAPGGGASNVWSYLLGGDVDLSITMTFISSIAAIGFMPLWMYTIGKYLIGDESIQLPIGNMLSTLASVIGPLCLGLLINRFLPKFGKIILKAQKVVVIITVAFAIGMGIYANLYAFEVVLFDYQLALCGISLPWMGGFLAFLIALLFKREKPVALTIGIETAIQNTGVATILLRTSLPQPWADISTAVPICLNLFTPIPLYFVGAGRAIYLKIKSKSPENMKLEEEESVESRSTALNVNPAFHTNLESEEKISEI